jgi:hypothetical protein
MTWLAAFVVSFAAIFAKSFQQKNVMHDRYWLVFPFSMLMAFMETSGVLLVARSDTVWIAIPIGCGGTIGCWLGMFLSGRLRSARQLEGNDVPNRRHNPPRMANPRGIENDLCNEWR